MLRSSLFKLIVLVSLISTVSCTLEPEKHEASGVSSFQVDTVEGNSITLPPSEKAINVEWNIKEAVGYSFQVCLIDRVTRTKIRGTRFSVFNSETGGEIPLDNDSKTNQIGCLKWREKLSYDFFAKESKYVLLKRQIRGEGIHKGEVSVTIAVNPWDRDRGGSAQEVLPYLNNAELSKEQIAQGPAAKALFSQGAKSLPMFMDDEDIRMVPHYEGYSVALNMDKVLGKQSRRSKSYKGNEYIALIQVEPKVPLMTLANAQFFFPLTRGKFAVQATLLATGLGKERKDMMILSEVDTLRAFAQSSKAQKGQVFELDGDGKLTVPLSVRLTNLSFRGRIQLALKLIPIGAPKSFTVYEGLYDLGDYRALVDSKKPFRLNSNQPRLEAKGYLATRKDEDRFNYDSYVRRAIQLKASTKSEKKNKFGLFEFNTLFDTKVGGVRASMLTMPPRKGTPYGKWNLSEAKTMSFTVCLVHKIKRGILPGQRFQVADSETGKLMHLENQGVTDSNGCLKWREVHTYEPLRKYPKYVLLNRTVIGLDEYPGSMEIKVAVNPWEQDRGGRRAPVYVYRDETELSGQALLSGGRVSELLMKKDQPLNLFADNEVVETYVGHGGYDLFFDMSQNFAEREKLIDKDQFFTMLLRLMPKAQMFTYDHQPVFKTFNQGQFSVQAVMTVTYKGKDGKPVTIELSKLYSRKVGAPVDPKTQGQIANLNGEGNLILPLKVQLIKKAFRGDINLALKLTPLGGVSQLKPYEALYKLGSYRNFFDRSKKPSLIATNEQRANLKSFDYDQYIKSAGALPEEQSVAGAVDPSAVMFRVNEVFGQLVTQKMTSPANVLWNLPESKMAYFTACLRRHSNEDPIQQQRFEVSDVHSKQTFQMENGGRTDANGCVRWSEEVPYQFLSRESKYILLDRNVRGMDEFTGDVQFQVAINPWERDRKGDAPEVYSYLKHPALSKGLVLEGALAQKFLRDPGHPSELWMSNVKTITRERTKDDLFKVKFSSNNKNVRTQKKYGKNIEEKELKGFRYRTILHLKPKVKLFQLDGGVHWHNLQDGKFKVWMNLVGSGVSGSKQRVLIANSDTYSQYGKGKSVRLLGDGSLVVPVDINVVNHMPYGDLTLAVKVVPEGAPANLSHFEALYMVGDFRDLKSGKNPFLIQTNHSGFSYDHYLATTTTGHNLISQDVFKFKPFYFKSLDIRFETVQAGESATVRSIVYRVKACIYDNIDGRAMRNDKFKIEIQRDGRFLPQSKEHLVISPESWDSSNDKQRAKYGKLPPYMSNEEGCLIWNDQIRHKYYMPEQLHKPKVKITHLRTGAVQDLELAINPWDEKWTFGRDGRTLSKEYVDKIEKREKPNSLFFLYRFSYDTLKFSYNIDEYLNLTVKKRVLLSLEPRALRYSSITRGRSMTEFLRDGIYLMKVAIQKDYLDPATKGLRIKRAGTKKCHKAQDGKEVCQGRTLHAIEIADAQGGVRKVSKRRLGIEGDTKQFISVRQKLVRVNNGHLITPVEFELEDLRLLRVRCQFLIQLETVREDLHTVTQTFIEESGLNADPRELNKIENFIGQDVPKVRADLKKQEEERSQNLHDEEKFKVAKSAQDQSQVAARFYADQIKKKTKDLNEMLTAYLKTLKRETDAQGQSIAGKQSWRNFKYIDDPELFKKIIQERMPELYEKVITKLEKNDFTSLSAAPPSGLITNYLDKLKDNSSGLMRRTFVGPITFLLNSNTSKVRPTDNLDEADCRNPDCHEPIDPEKELAGQRSETDMFILNKKYYGGINHFAKYAQVRKGDPEWMYYKNRRNRWRGIHVDDLLQEKVELDRIKKIEKKANSLVYRFLEQNNMDFISFRDEVPKRIQSRCYANGAKSKTAYALDKEGCFTDPKKTYVEDESRSFKKDYVFKFINSIPDYKGVLSQWWNSDKEQKQVNSEDLVDHMVNNKPFTEEAAEKVCYFWLGNMLGIHSKGWSAEKAAAKMLQAVSASPMIDLKHRIKLCTEALVDYQGPSTGVIKNKKLRVFKTGQYQFLGGKSMNVNVGAKFDLYYKKDMGVSAGVNLPVKTVGQGLGRIGGMIGAGFGKVLSIFDASVKVGEGRGISDGTSVAQQTFLVMQASAFDIVVEDYEVCMELKWADDMLESNRDLLKRHLKSSISGNVWSAEGLDDHSMMERYGDRLLKGLFVCSGHREKKKPIAVRERYYYFTQHFTEGDLLDQGDLYNHPWLLKIRGLRDVETFLNVVQAQPVSLFTRQSLKKATSNRDNYVLDNFVKHNQWPIHKLNDAYRQATPAFPRMYTILGGPEYKYERPEVIREHPVRYKPSLSMKRFGLRTLLGDAPSPFGAEDTRAKASGE